MSQRKTLVVLGIDIFTHISAEKIYNMVKDFKTCRCALEFDILFLGLISKENK